MILSCGAVNRPWPRRFAGTCNAYSGSAISQLRRITTRSARSLNLRWPYHATVMKTLDRIRRKTVFMMCESRLRLRRGPCEAASGQRLLRDHDLRLGPLLRDDGVAQLAAVNLAHLVLHV